MKMLNKKTFLKLLACLLVATQSILVALVATFYLNSSYTEKVMNFSEQAITIKIRNTSDTKNYDIYNYLQESTVTYKLFFSRLDSISAEAGDKKFEVGLFGEEATNEENLNLTFLDQTILDKERIANLLNSQDQEASIGLDKSSSKTLYDIPSFFIGESIVFKKFDALLERSGTMNGEYKILGLSQDEQDKFLEGLARVSGVSKESFTDNMSGRFLDSSLKEIILLGLLFAHSLIFLAIFVYLAISNLKNLGTLILQGWSRLDFVKHVYSTVVGVAIVNIPLSIVYGSFFTYYSIKTYLFYSSFIFVGFLSFLLVIILMALASLLIFLVKPIAAVKDRIPKKIYLAIAGFFYVLFSGSLVFVSIYIDAPYREIERSMGISSKWKSVEDINILEGLSPGDDSSSFSLQSKKLDQDIYNWYKSIRDEEGVNIISSTKVTSEMLNTYRANKLYKHVADEEFWQVKASPNYLLDSGVKLSRDLIEKAKAGKRVFLIPSNLYKNNLMEMIIEDDSDYKEGDIQTKFTENMDFEFVEYDEDISLFSWRPEATDELYIKNPVILVLTAENMIFMESESLKAGGISNSFIKLSEEANQKYTTQEYMKQFNLDDNNIKFSSVAEHIDGLQKNLWKTINFFGMLIVGITFILLILLLVIFLTFELANKEKIAIQQFLGYSKLTIYKYPLIFIAGVLALELAAILFWWSKIGMLYMAFIILLHIILILVIIKNNGIDKATRVFKS